MIKQIVLTIGLIITIGSTCVAQPKDQIEEMCSKGNPWILPKVDEQFSRSELYLNLNAAAGSSIRICHCTDNGDRGVPYIWVRAQAQPGSLSEEEVAVSHSGVSDGGKYGISVLRGQSCLDATGSFVVIHHSNEERDRWGTYIRLDN